MGEISEISSLTTMTKSPQSLPKDCFVTHEPSQARSKQPWRRFLALVIGGLWIAVLIVRSLRTLSNGLQPLSQICEQPTPAGMPSNLSRFVDEPGFALAAANKLAGAVRIPTMSDFSIITPDVMLTFVVRSFDDMGPVDEDERWAPFEDMHKYLRNVFPLMCVYFKSTFVIRSFPLS